jgi:hypothetical protein
MTIAGYVIGCAKQSKLTFSFAKRVSHGQFRSTSAGSARPVKVVV